MWRAQAGSNVQIQADEDDDWETDPDFVVSKIKRLTWVAWFAAMEFDYAHHIKESGEYSRLINFLNIKLCILK